MPKTKNVSSISRLAQLSVNLPATVPILKIERQVSIDDKNHIIESICDGLETFGSLALEILTELVI